MRNVQLRIALIASLALIASACVGNGGSVVQPESDPAADVGSESTIAAASPDPTGGAPELPDEQGAAVGLLPSGEGTVVIDGETFEAEWVRNCKIDEPLPGPDDLELKTFLGGISDGLFLKIAFREVYGVPAEDSYRYTQFNPVLLLFTDSGLRAFESSGTYVTDPDGAWYIDEMGNLPMWLALGSAGPDNDVESLAGPPMVIEGDRITGAVTLEGDTGPIELSFELTFLTDAIDCSL